MTYRPDQPQPSYPEQLQAQRTRFVLAMLYALPFALTPLALGGVVLYRGLPDGRIEQTQTRATALRSAMLSTTEQSQLLQFQQQLERLDHELAALQTRRADYIRARPWAAAFCAIGIVLIVAWSVVLVKLLRKRDLLVFTWRGPPGDAPVSRRSGAG